MSTESHTKTGAKIYSLAFDKQPREPRSEAYKSGALAGILGVLQGETVQNPMTPGTAQSDAWYSGQAEGRWLGRSYLEGTFPQTKPWEGF